MSAPQTVWLIVFVILVPYELWALIWGGYEMTLTKGMRDWLAACPALKGFLFAFLGWLAFHFCIDKREKK